MPNNPPDHIEALQPGASWHRHPYGGGWVSHSATVASTAYLDAESVVSHDAQLLNDARVTGQCIIRGDAIVRGSAMLDGTVTVRHSAIVRGSAQASGDCIIEDTAIVEDNASCADNARVSGATVLNGTATLTEQARVTAGTWGAKITHGPIAPGWYLTHTTPTDIRIGSEDHPIATWVTDWATSLAPHGLTAVQIARAKTVIDYIDGVTP